MSNPTKPMPTVRDLYFDLIHMLEAKLLEGEFINVWMRGAIDIIANEIGELPYDDYCAKRDLSNEELERQMVQLAGATRVTTGNIS